MIRTEIYLTFGIQPLEGYMGKPVAVVLLRLLGQIAAWSAAATAQEGRLWEQPSSRGQTKKGPKPRWLEHPGGPETEVADLRRVAFGPPENDMIEQGNIDGLGRFAQQARHLKVSGARGRVPAYAACGISGVMPHPVLCRVEPTFRYEDGRRHAA